MAQDRDDREGRGRGGYGHRDDYARWDRSRDWSDRVGDEVRSWLGDDDAERRRRMDEARGYGMAGSGRRGAYYADEGGGFGGGSGYDPYGSGRGDATATSRATWARACWKPWPRSTANCPRR